MTYRPLNSVIRVEPVTSAGGPQQAFFVSHETVITLEGMITPRVVRLQPYV